MASKLNKAIVLSIISVIFLLIIIYPVKLKSANVTYKPVIEISMDNSNISQDEAETIAKKYIKKIGYDCSKFKEISSVYMSDYNWHITFNENENILDGGLTVLIEDESQIPLGYSISGCRDFYNTDSEGNIISVSKLNDYGN